MLRPTIFRAWLTVAVLLAGCGQGTDRREDAAGEIYAAAIRWLVDDARPAGPTTGERVFVEAVDGAVIPLPVQVDVVNRLEETLAVRFIDSRQEAIDTALPGDPVREEGILVGLGAVVNAENPPVSLYGDRYRDIRDVVAYGLILDQGPQGWEVTGEPHRLPVVERPRSAR